MFRGLGGDVCDEGVSMATGGDPIPESTTGNDGRVVSRYEAGRESGRKECRSTFGNKGRSSRLQGNTGNCSSTNFQLAVEELIQITHHSVNVPLSQASPQNNQPKMTP